MRRATAVGTVLGTLLALAACGPDRRVPDAPAVPVGSSEHAIRVDGRDRTYRAYRPASLPSGEPVALVVMLHGGFGSADQAEEAYGWDAEADREGFVVAYPDGLGRAWAVGGGCCGQSGRTGVDDVAFAEAMVAQVSDRLPIDPARIYATGISNGGMLAYRLACDSTVFAAIGPDSATLLGPCDDPAPISVIHIHGTADTRIRYEGGKGDGVAGIDGPPVPEVIARWREVARCGPSRSTTDDTVTASVVECPGGVTVELITIDGAGHQWPGSKPKTLVDRALGLDPPSTALDATDTIWRFFATHTLH
jgi:polyhydroxybutyrate depolymerase